MFGIEKDFQNLMEQVYGPLSEPVKYETPMTKNEEEIEKVKAQIKVLQSKLSFLEELEKTKSPVEEAFKDAYGKYPVKDVSEDLTPLDNWNVISWDAFQKGYNAAYEEKVVEEEPKDNEWKNVALEFGKKLRVILPYSYFELSPNSWYRWVVFTYDKYMEERDKECGYTPNQKAQEPEEQVSFVPKEIKELVKESVKWCEEHPDKDPLDWVKPQTPEQVADGLKEAFREAQQTEKWKELQRKIDEQDNDKNFKNSLDIIKEWAEKNKPPTLYQLIEDWWCDVFCANSTDDMETCIDGLVDKIDKQFIPPSHNTNDYQWNKCLKMMRDKLR